MKHPTDSPIPIRGLNLGGWLVLEKWMTPELFEGTTAEDEYHLLLERGSDTTWLTHHRDTFITKADFQWIRDHGIDTIRLPVGHWTYNAPHPYLPCDSYVEQAFAWAEETGLQVLLDVHAAPGCQNGFDNGGLAGVCQWHKDPHNIDQTLRFINQLCLHLKHHPALAGIQVLNEPRWDIPMDIIRSFYDRSYRLIRSHLDASKYIVFHDAFRLEEWEDYFRSRPFENVILDTHMYQVFAPEDQRGTIPDLFHKIGVRRARELQSMQDIVDVVVGEWSGAIHPHALSLCDPSVHDALYRAVANTLLVTFDVVRGWFFWNYKLSEQSTQTHRGWSFLDSVNRGDLPLLKGVKQ
jgi:glucan 1,3-beta-glucosidase